MECPRPGSWGRAGAGVRGAGLQRQSGFSPPQIGLLLPPTGPGQGGVCWVSFLVSHRSSVPGSLSSPWTGVGGTVHPLQGGVPTKSRGGMGPLPAFSMYRAVQPSTLSR